MKHLKKIGFLFVMVAFITSCNNENDFYQEQVTIDQEINKDITKAREVIPQNFEDQLFATYKYDMYGHNFSPSTYELDYNGFYFRNTDKIIALDYNQVDGLVYMIQGDYRDLYSFDLETSQKTYIGPLSGDDEPSKSFIKLRDDYLGIAHNLTFDADGNLYVAYESGKIMKYDLETNEMDEFVDLYDYEFYIGADKVGFTYDFDNDRLLYSSEDFEEKYIEGFHNYYYNSVFLGINCSTAAVSELFTLRNPEIYYNSKDIVWYYARTKNMEYIGDNKIVYTEKDYYTFYAVDVISGEYVFADDDGNLEHAKNLMYVYNPDYDNDGILNEDDPYPNSNMSEYVSIDGCYPDIDNVFSDEGTTMMDEIDALVAEINAQYDGENYDELHRDFTRGISKITYYWRKDRLITRGERSDISSCAWRANIPYFNNPV